MMRTLRDMNMSKFVAEDVPLFLSLIQDLFPIQKTERNSFPEVSAALEKVLAALPSGVNASSYRYVCNDPRTVLMQAWHHALSPGAGQFEPLFELHYRAVALMLYWDCQGCLGEWDYQESSCSDPQPPQGAISATMEEYSELQSYSTC